MLFNSRIFVFVFLPVTVALGLAAARFMGSRASLLVLMLCSLVFYAWWQPTFLVLLLVSILVNFWVGQRLSPASPKALLVGGLCFNLVLLGYFKYRGFFASLAGFPDAALVLPLGISFFTFQQIMFLVDRSRGDLGGETRFLDYVSFVAFFPHLIAGPIVRPREIIPQFRNFDPLCDWRAGLQDGLEIFLLGLAKKIVLADNFASFADPGFAAAAAHDPVTLIEAWVSLLTYSLQIYFDFSGYSDMAIGLARMFGIDFPRNFNSPYQARNISAFWRRWNMTLSAFLRDYLYIPLGGNRKGEARRIVNLMVTMLLGGLWHGAALKFLLWGGLHGIFLTVHGWFARLGWRLPIFVSRALTLLAVILAWVPFRAQSFGAAAGFYKALAGGNGVAVPSVFAQVLPGLGRFVSVVPVLPYLGDGRPLSLTLALAMLGTGWMIVLALPNLQDFGARRKSFAMIGSFAFTMQALVLAPAAVPFLYFQF
jgi:D-alanyl-lipoteichoic acid acyltransferase DltB (MBOAT superfamily)